MKGGLVDWGRVGADDLNVPSGIDGGIDGLDQKGDVCWLTSSGILVRFSELSYFLSILSLRCETVVACKFSFEPDGLKSSSPGAWPLPSLLLP